MSLTCAYGSCFLLTIQLSSFLNACRMHAHTWYKVVAASCTGAETQIWDISLSPIHLQKRKTQNNMFLIAPTAGADSLCLTAPPCLQPGFKKRERELRGNSRKVELEILRLHSRSRVWSLSQHCLERKAPWTSHKFISRPHRFTSKLKFSVFIN